MQDFIPWFGVAANVLTVAYVAGVLVQRVTALEKRLDSKASKDDARDAILTDIRVSVAQINQKIDVIQVKRITLW